MRVLLVDDSTTMHKIQSNQLRSLGVTDILTACNGEEGLKVLKANMPVDIVVLDINMPVMDGLTTLKKIREDPALKNIRVVMVTTESEKMKVLEAVRAGANDYIVKPFELADYKERILGKQL